MSKGITAMTSSQIRDRLKELDTVESELAAIDHDAALSAALLSGADVNSLEAAQLESERLARRLRVERQALNGALPEAIRREALPQITKLAEQHTQTATQARQTSQRIAALWQELSGELAHWMEHRRESVELTRQAAQVAANARLPVPKLGAFVDKNLMTVLIDIRDARARMGTAAEHGANVGSDYQAFELSPVE